MNLFRSGAFMTILLFLGLQRQVRHLLLVFLLTLRQLKLFLAHPYLLNNLLNRPSSSSNNNQTTAAVLSPNPYHHPKLPRFLLLNPSLNSLFNNKPNNRNNLSSHVVPVLAAAVEDNLAEQVVQPLYRPLLLPLKLSNALWAIYALAVPNNSRTSRTVAVVLGVVEGGMGVDVTNSRLNRLKFPQRILISRV